MADRGFIWRSPLNPWLNIFLQYTALDRLCILLQNAITEHAKQTKEPNYMMTYVYPDDRIRTAVEAIRAGGPGNGDFLPGDGFDKNDAPRLDRYVERLGYEVVEKNRHGPGQLLSVHTACGLRFARNGSCVRLRDPEGPARFRTHRGPDGETRMRRT